MAPVPFRDADDLDELGAAAYLKIEPSEDGDAYLGALLLINARGEPLEFVYNRVDLPQTFLWRAADLRRHAERRLATALFDACGATPQILLHRADEVTQELFGQDLDVQIPVGRLSLDLDTRSGDGATAAEAIVGSGRVNVFWHPAPPANGSAERRLFDHLQAHGLLLEPFERALIGLHAVYAESAGDQFWT